MLALVDGDIVAYRVAWTVQDQETFGIPKWRVDEMLDGILVSVGADSYQVYLSGPEEDNFRYTIYPRYKKSRKGKPRPKWLEEIKEHLVIVWGARIACNMEADDALGIYQDKDMKFGQALIKREGADNLQFKWDNMHTVICTIDKDLKQIPGLHYNFVTKEKSFVNIQDGLRCFYRQILTGDSGDDIPGIYGIGPNKSAKILGSGGTESEFLGSVYKSYCKKLTPNAARLEIQQNGSLLKIKQKEDEGVWQAPWHLINDTKEDKAQEETTNSKK